MGSYMVTRFFSVSNYIDSKSYATGCGDDRFTTPTLFLWTSQAEQHRLTPFCFRQQLWLPRSVWRASSSACGGIDEGWYWISWHYGISATIRSRILEVPKCRKLPMQALLHFLGVRRCLGSELYQLRRRRRRRSLFELTMINYALYKHLRAHTDFVALYGEWTSVCGLVSLSEIFHPRWFWELVK